MIDYYDNKLNDQYFNQENSWQACNYSKVVQEKLENTKQESIIKRINIKPEILKN